MIRDKRLFFLCGRSYGAAYMALYNIIDVFESCYGYIRELLRVTHVPSPRPHKGWILCKRPRRRGNRCALSNNNRIHIMNAFTGNTCESIKKLHAVEKISYIYLPSVTRDNTKLVEPKEFRCVQQVHDLHIKYLEIKRGDRRFLKLSRRYL